MCELHGSNASRFNIRITSAELFDARAIALPASIESSMAPGGIVVREGDEVRAGQVIGRLGNSGDSDGPHLHWQIMGSAPSLNANGLPFALDQMTYRGQLLGTLDSVMDTLFSGQAPRIDTGGAALRALQMPLTLDLVRFR